MIEEVQKTIQFFEQSYKKQQQIIYQLCSQSWKEDTEENNIHSWNQSSIVLANSLKKINQQKEFQTLYTIGNTEYIDPEDVKLYTIYDSLIHMTNNRLGLYLRDEPFIAFLIAKGLETLNN